MNVEAFDHLHIYSLQPEASAAFYQKFFGAEQVGEMKNVYGQTRRFLLLGGQLIVVGPFPPDLTAKAPPELGDGAYTHGFGIAHFGLRVKDVAEAVKELRLSGVEVYGEPIEEESGLCYAYVAAPDGVVIELTQYGLE